jgi:hypothetical protein
MLLVNQIENEVGRRGACMGDMRNAYKSLSENLKEREHLGDVSIDGMIILRLILRK